MENNTNIVFENVIYDLGNMTINKVFEFLKAKDLKFRVVSYEDQSCIITDDLVPGRVNLTIKGSEITNVDIEGNTDKVRIYSKEEAEKWANIELEQIRKDNLDFEEEIFKNMLLGLPQKWKITPIQTYTEEFKKRDDRDIYTDLQQYLESDNPTDLF